MPPNQPGKQVMGDETRGGAPPAGRTPTLRIFGYAIGEGAMSITMNGIANFAMLYYSQVLGLGAGMAGLALSITMLWDAVTDPVMGHITDNTRTRFGRRHPYILFGGLGLAVSFYLLWALPRGIEGATALFWAILLLNLVVRTMVTVFSIPFTALGFEICPHYEDRAKLQGIRAAFNQAVNLIFGAFAWTMFFRDGKADDGARLDGTLIESNYLTMATTLSLAAVILIVACVIATRRYAVDNRSMPVAGNSPGAFFRDLAGIFRDPLMWRVFGFFGLAQLGMLLTSQVQMFTYVFFVELAATEKTIVHGGGMVAFAMGAMLQARMTRRFDKRPTAHTGMVACVGSGLFLFTVFIGGIVQPDAVLQLGGWAFPLGKGVFAVGQWLWWGGCGMLVPLTMSMVADLSEINYRRSGILKDGSYAACFTFFVKACMSIGLLLTGQMVEAAGIVPGAETQTPEAARNIAALTFLCGPILVVISFFVFRLYPVDRTAMQRISKCLPGEAGPIIDALCKRRGNGKS